MWQKLDVKKLCRLCKSVAITKARVLYGLDIAHIQACLVDPRNIAYYIHCTLVFIETME